MIPMASHRLNQTANERLSQPQGNAGKRPGATEGIPMRSAPNRHRSIMTRWLTLVAALLLCVPLSGCSYVLFLGYLIGGPPSVEPEFEAQTDESLSDKDVTVAVVCFAPTEVRYSFENIDNELAKYVTFRLVEHKIKAIPPDYVKAWLDENKEWDRPEEIGNALKANYIVYIDLNEFSLYEEGSASLYRGRSEAIVSVWKMDEGGEAEKIFSAEKISKYPLHQPISTSEETFTNFKGRYLSRLSEEIGRFFYEYYLSDEIAGGG